MSDTDTTSAPKAQPASLLLVLGSLVAVGVLLLGGFVAMFYFAMTSKVMKKPSPDKQHTAKLVRVQGIDVNFKVSVDGRRVYTSPDFRPVDADFREQIVWDTNSQVVVLEVAGERIFGYHAVEKRQLRDSELLSAQFTPFDQLRFEGELPKRTAIN